MEARSCQCADVLTRKSDGESATCAREREALTGMRGLATIPLQGLAGHHHYNLGAAVHCLPLQ